jgi:hypothetical protein
MILSSAGAKFVRVDISNNGNIIFYGHSSTIDWLDLSCVNFYAG